MLFVCFVAALLAGIVTCGLAEIWWRADPGGPVVQPRTVGTEVRRHPGAARWLRTHLDPQLATGSLLALIGIVAVVGGLLLGTLLEMVRAHQGFATFDAGAARFGAAHATSTSTQVLRIITQLGGAAVVVPIAIVVALFEGRRDSSWAPVAFLAVVVGGQYALANLIKAAVDRARPDLLRLTGFSGPSFPSGHATASAAAFAAFALLIGRGWSRNRKVLLAGVSVGAAVLISATRVILGVHWLTDVLAGLCLGWTWFVVASLAFGGRRLRFGAPLIIAQGVVDGLVEGPSTPTDHDGQVLPASTSTASAVRVDRHRHRAIPPEVEEISGDDHRWPIGAKGRTWRRR